MTDIIDTLTRARDALAPFTEYDRCRPKQNAPKTGVLFGVETVDGAAEITCEHLAEAAAAVSDLNAAIAAAGWRPIESAPKDRTEIQLIRDGGYDVGKWDDDRYASKPRPYWASDLKSYLGITWARKNVPTLWCPCQPLPAQPATTENKP